MKFPFIKKKKAKVIKLKPGQFDSRIETTPTRELPSPGVSEKELSDVMESAKQYYSTPERLSREEQELRAQKKQFKKEIREEEGIPEGEKCYYTYEHVKSAEPKGDNITSRTYQQLKARKEIPFDEFTGESLLTDKEKQLAEKEKIQIRKQKVNNRGWGNPWGNLRPLTKRKLASYDRANRTVKFTNIIPSQGD